MAFSTQTTQQSNALITQHQPVTVSVCTFNVLAARYGKTSSFPYAKKQHLKWKTHRRNLVLSELASSHSDILFLQEVDRIKDIENHLRGQHYLVSYQKRPNRKCDGCVIAWKTSKFELCSPLYVSNYNELCPKDASNHSDQWRFCKDNIGMIVVLRCVSNPKMLVIAANTHLHWNPVISEVKLWQAASFMKSIEWVIDKHALQNSNYKLIIGGDWNSMPDSDVYAFIINGDIQHKPASVFASANLNDNADNNEETKETKENDENKGNKDSQEPNATHQKLLRIVADRDLRKTAQWLSLIEIDAAYFGKNSTEEYEALFDIARDENRIIVTRNKTITQRSDCPKFVLIGARETQQQAFQHILNAFNIQIDLKKKQHRENIVDCLACPKCMKKLVQKTITDIRDKLPQNSERIQNGKSARGKDLEFWQCVNCEHLVYHRAGWLDRLHERRQEHYNTSKNLHKQLQKNNDQSKHASINKEKKVKKENTENEEHKQQQNGVNGNINQKNEKKYTNEIGYKHLMKKYSAIAKIMPKHVYRKRRPVICGIDIIHGSFKKYDRIYAWKSSSNILDLGIIAEMQDDGNEVALATKGSNVCLKLETEHCYGRQFSDKCYLVKDYKRELTNLSVTSSTSIPIQQIPYSAETYPSLFCKRLQHPFKVKSVYSSFHKKEPIVTNYTQTFQGCLDYIFVSENINIVHVDRLPKPPYKEKDDDNGDNGDNDEKEEILHCFLPDETHPSDHLPIKATLKL